MSHVMPDFTDRLEQQLRSAALAGGASPRRRRRGAAFRLQVRHARLAAAGAACLAIALVAVLVSGLSDHATPRAYGKPLLLQTPTVDATTQFENSTYAAESLGPGARFDHAYPITVFGGTAYVVSGDRGWCMSVPNPGLPDEHYPSAVTCTTNAQFLSDGIAVLVGSSYLAALPQGVKDPVVQRPGSTPEELEPSGQGVVVATGLPSGTSITSYSTSGAPTTITVP
jgi:hypothetical protein